MAESLRKQLESAVDAKLNATAVEVVRQIARQGSATNSDYFILADQCRILCRVAEGLNALSAITTIPKSMLSDYLVLKAMLFEDAGDLVAATECFSEAIDLVNCQDETVVLEYTYFLSRHGRLLEAEAVLIQALAVISVPSSGLYESAANNARSLNQWKRAMDILKRARNAGFDSDELNHISRDVQFASEVSERK